MIEKIKSDFQKHLNREIKVVAKENRNRNEIFYGKIVELYAHNFIVSNGIEKKSYTYADVLCRDIQVTFL